MNKKSIGNGGFFLPDYYHKDQKSVLESFMAGEIDYADFTQWSFADEFLCFILQVKFFEFADRTYPNPRKKNEVPIWFLIASQFVLRIHNSRHYDHLKYFLNAGSILTKVGFNISTQYSLGFNGKNKYERETAVDPGTVRKFFKDTDKDDIRNWYNEDLQRWFKAHKVYDPKGLFILDQSHLVVPKNKNYIDAKMMPVDEHGQFYDRIELLSNEQKKALIYHPCYAMSCLLHTNTSGDLYHVSSYELGSGSDDELVHARKLVPEFCKNNPSVMKELIMDRGYLDGAFIGRLKNNYNVDVLIPLKKNMDDYKDAVDIANRKNKWSITQEDKDSNGNLLVETHTACVENMDLWNECPLKLNVYVSKTKKWNSKNEKIEEYTWVLAATKKYPTEKAAIERYSLRVIVEERFRQLKRSWHIMKFPSPAPGLIETHVAFTMLTYSLLQLYLRRSDMRDLAKKTIETLRKEERMGKDAVLIYANGAFAVLNLDEYTLTVIDMNEDSRSKLKGVMQHLKEARLKRNG